MAELQNNSAERSGKTQTLNEVLMQLGYLKPEGKESTEDEILRAVLTRIQRMHVPDRYILMSEHWDWLVVLHCLQDHNLFRSNPKRPPLSAFAAWVKQNNIPQLLAHCSMREMSLANTGIRGARYPWAGVAWEPYVLNRWRILYRTLDKLLTELEQSSQTDV